MLKNAPHHLHHRVAEQVVLVGVVGEAPGGPQGLEAHVLIGGGQLRHHRGGVGIEVLLHVRQAGLVIREAVDVPGDGIQGVFLEHQLDDPVLAGGHAELHPLLGELAGDGDQAHAALPEAQLPGAVHQIVEAGSRQEAPGGGGTHHQAAALKAGAQAADEVPAADAVPHLAVVRLLDHLVGGGGIDAGNGLAVLLDLQLDLPVRHRADGGAAPGIGEPQGGRAEDLTAAGIVEEGQEGVPPGKGAGGDLHKGFRRFHPFRISLQCVYVFRSV